MTQTEIELEPIQKTYKIRIKKANLVQDNYGSYIKISMIKLLDENDKYIKFIKLNQKTLEILLNTDITIKL
jgi:hypothetical protein